MTLSRQDVSEMTSTTLFTISRILHGCEQDELMETGRQRVVIKQPLALVKIAPFRTWFAVAQRRFDPLRLECILRAF
jgi:hypothetical protein